MNSKDRLKVAKTWAKGVKTKKKIKAYRKCFGVDKCCAAKELTMAEVELHEKFANRWATRVERKRAAKKIRKKQQQDKIILEQYQSDSDETFYYIAGYTPGGAAYGTTWEQAQKEGLLSSDALLDNSDQNNNLFGGVKCTHLVNQK